MNKYRARWLVHNAQFSCISYTNFMSISTKTTLEPKQMEPFSRMSEQWWDEYGTVKPLHALNMLRVPWIRDRLHAVGAFTSALNTGSPLEGLLILDVGCGGGILSEPLSRLGANVTGLDCNSDMVKVAMKRLKKNKLLNLRYTQSTIEEHVGENAEKYDVVIASETIEHIKEKGEFVKCCVKCLKPGGSIFVTTNSKSFMSKFLAITVMETILRQVPTGTHEYDMFIDIDDLKELLKIENCATIFTSGMMYNPLRNRWFFVENHYILHYVLHAVKLK